MKTDLLVDIEQDYLEDQLLVRRPARPGQSGPEDARGLGQFVWG